MSSSSNLLILLIVYMQSCLVITSDGSPSLISKTLKLVAVVHRHGDRAPLNFLPGDPYADSAFWPDGKSQLLATGKDRLYSLGQSLRQYYGHFLTDNPREVHARSSDADRCIESAEMLFNGLYRAVGRWRYSNKTDYLPIPVHTVPKNYDKMLAEGVDCPALNKELGAVFARPESKSFLTSYSRTLAILSEKLGFPIADLGLVLGLYDPWYIERSLNYTLPDWVTPAIWSDLAEMVDLYSTIQNDSPLIHHLRAGTFFDDLKRNLLDLTKGSNHTTIEQPSTQLKLLTYSTHDTMLGAFMSALKIFNGLRVPYGAALLIELLTADSPNIIDDDHQYYIQIKYWNDTYVNKQHELHLPFCQSGPLCTLDEFLGYIEQFIPTDWESECSITGDGDGHNHQTPSLIDDNVDENPTWRWLGIVTVSCLCLITVIILILCATFYHELYKKSRQSNRSEREKQEYDRIL